MRLSFAILLVVLSGVLSDSPTTDSQDEYRFPNVSQADSAEALASFTYLHSAADEYIKSVDTMMSMSDEDFAGVNKVIVTAVGVKKSIKVAAKVSAVFLGIFQNRRQYVLKRQQLRKISNKLNAIYDRMLQMEETLIASIEFNGWMPMYTEYVANIRAGLEKLSETTQRAMDAPDQRTSLRFIQDFMTFYENNQIEVSYNNLYLAASQSHKFQNMFDLYVNDRGCLAQSVSKLYLLINSALLSGALQMSTYSFLRHGSWELSQKPLVDNLGNSFDVRSVYYHHVWICLKYFQDEAEAEMANFVEISTDSKELQTLLHSKFPLYDWTTLTHGNFDRSIRCQGSNRNLRNVGQNSIYVRATVDRSRRAVATFTYRRHEDLSERDCPFARYGQTIVYFPGSHSLTTDSKTLNSVMCRGERERVARRHSNCNPRSNGDVRFIAAEFESHVDDCRSSTCGENGVCRMIPHTRLHYCQCRPFYVGQKCEFFEIPEAGENITKAIASLQLKTKDFIGVPDIVDLYLSFQGLQHKLASVKETLQDDIKYSRLVSLGGNTWSRISFILDQYRQVTEGDISEDTFQQSMSELDNTPYYTLRTHNLLITGAHEGQDGEDLLTTYKRALFNPEEGCSETYIQHVKSMMDHIVYSDMVLTNVHIRMKQFSLEHLTQSEQEATVQHIQAEVAKAEQRWGQYRSIWHGESCPSLTYANLQNTCAAPVSFEGMQVTPVCGNNTFTSLKPSEKLTCTNKDGDLYWSQESYCMDCDERFHHFRCNNQVCIDKALRCNEQVDCPGSAMEDEMGCPGSPIISEGSIRLIAPIDAGYLDWGSNSLLRTSESTRQETTVQATKHPRGYWLRSGDVIRLQEPGRSRWMRCSGSCSFTTSSTATLRTYRIHAVGQHDGYVLRSGDRVGLRVVDHATRWVGISNNRPTAMDCPKSPEDLRACPSHIWTVHIY